MFKLAFVAIFVFSLQSAALAADARMQVDVLAEAHDVKVQWLHSHVQEAAVLALSQLWQRIVPQHAHGSIPKRIKAIRFLQKASPTADGIRIVFHQQRVLSYLKKNDLPYIAEQPALNVVVQLYNAAGQPMRQTAHALLGFAAEQAASQGYRMDDQGTALVLLWRWLDQQQVSLSVRGNSRLQEFSDTRQLHAGDPLLQLKPWLIEVVMQARDAYAQSAESSQSNNTGLKVTHAVTDDVADISHKSPLAAAQPMAQDMVLQLNVQRQASLPDQVLFEDELQQDPRILNLSLKQVNIEGQLYRLQLKGSDDQWLSQWFARRGMTLTPTIEGWVAR